MAPFLILLLNYVSFYERVSSKGYTLMYSDEIDQTGDWEVWGIEGFPDNNCCTAVQLDDTGNHAEGAFLGWQSLTSTQNIAWIGEPGNVDYEQLLVETYTTNNNQFQITRKDDNSHANRYLAVAYVDGSSCSNNTQFNATALFVANTKNLNQIAYGCVNIDNGRFHVISENTDHYGLFGEDTAFDYSGSVYDPITKQFTIGFAENSLPPFAHIVITVNAVDGSDYRERLFQSGYMPWEMHYSSAISNGYPSILTYSQSSVNSYGMYSLQSKDYKMIVPSVEWITMAPIGNQSYGIALDTHWNVYKFELAIGNSTIVGKLSGSGIGKLASGSLQSFAVTN
eukprot:416537_1